MKKTSLLIKLSLLLFVNLIYSQTVELTGQVENEEGLEGIHVINKTQKFYTTTNQVGQFNIEAAVNDTIVLTAIQYKQVTLIVTKEQFENKAITVKLEEQVNELDEVLVGNTLTGDLLKDVNNSEAKPNINFYDVGIPGYTGKPKTQSERRLNEAGEFKPKMLLGLLTGSVPLNPILNGLSGRTKELKNRVKLEANTELMYSLKDRLLESFLVNNPLKEDQIMDFFYFCSEDENFMTRCKNSDIEALNFLEEKYKQYQENLTSKE